MQIVKQIWEKFQRVAELTLEVLENGIDFISFQEKLRRELDGLGQEILREVLEAKDAYLREHREERPGWQVERQNDAKGVLTLFGLVNYKRTYYKHKETGERAYLIDHLVGYGPHARVDPLVKAQALETAVELSYRKSGEGAGRGNREVVLRGEAVKKVVHNFTPAELPEPPKEKRRVKALYVEADEDHIAGKVTKRATCHGWFTSTKGKKRWERQIQTQASLIILVGFTRIQTSCGSRCSVTSRNTTTYLLWSGFTSAAMETGG